MKLSQTEVGCFSGFKFAPYTVTKAQRLPATMGRAQISRVIRSYGSKERQSPSSHRPLFYSFHACSFVFGFSQISQARCTCYSSCWNILPSDLPRPALPIFSELHSLHQHLPLFSVPLSCFTYLAAHTAS